MLSHGEVRALVPGLGDGVVGAAYCPRGGHANPIQLMRACHCDTLANGGVYLPGRNVDAIKLMPRSFVVHCDADHFIASKLVIAAGLGRSCLAPNGRPEHAAHPARRSDPGHRTAAAAPRPPHSRSCGKLRKVP
jgi:L-2-hydroxyglutarate oxidase LhgO